MNSNTLLFLRLFISIREEKLEELKINFPRQWGKWKLGINLSTAYICQPCVGTC